MNNDLYHVVEPFYVYTPGFTSMLWLEVGDIVLITGENCD